MEDSLDRPLVTVIIPCYNVERYVVRSVSSVLAQTYRRLEVIAIDDGSTDSTFGALQRLAAHDPRLIVKRGPNQGVSAARNLGCSYATGEFLTFVDGDDWLDEQTVARAVDCQRRTDSDVVMWAYTSEFRTSSAPRHLFSGDRTFGSSEVADLRRRIVGPVGPELANPARLDSLVTVWGKLYRTDTIHSRQVTFADHLLEDALFNLTYLRWATSAAYLDLPLYHYRRTNDASLTKSPDNDYVARRSRVLDEMQRLVEPTDVVRQALANRTALGVLGISLVDLAAQRSLWERRAFICALLRQPRYASALRDLQIEAMPLPWRVYYWLARHQLAIPFLAMTMLIRQILRR